MPNYCNHCILPDTRPGVKLDHEGVCKGCRNALLKAQIDWLQRERAFCQVVENARVRSSGYDCVIPVSGGKDSYWQVLKCLEYGLHPLCVTYAYPGRTELGQRNLQGLINIGVDHFDFRPNPGFERSFIDKAFRIHAISGLPSHMAIYAFPIRLAVAMNIPLVVYGENTAFEYGTEEDALMGPQVDRAWLRTFGVTAGTTAEDWVREGLARNSLQQYFVPSEAELEAAGTRAIFLGHYFAWDPEQSRAAAVEHGFEVRREGARVGHYDFVNIDDDMIAVHHHPKWHKFGITRSWDTLSMEIRSGRLTRNEAIEKLTATGDETPWEDIAHFCDYLGMEQQEYFSILERFRNKTLWSRRDGRWKIDDFLIPDFEWPEDPVVKP